MTDDPETAVDEDPETAVGEDPETAVDEDPETAVDDALDAVDSDVVAALVGVLEDDPEALRGFLRREGYLDPGLREMGPTLTEAEELLLEVLDDVEAPRSTGELQDIVALDHAEKLSAYESFKHRPWISEKVNSLAKKGYVGKYRDGREVKFTPDPTEAVRRWALHNERFGSELSRSDVGDVVADTGMRPAVVREAIRTLSEE